MKVDIQRICLKAKLSKNNPEFHEWETASIVILVPENDNKLAVKKAKVNIIGLRIYRYSLARCVCL